jgi:hypothetical protein
MKLGFKVKGRSTTCGQGSFQLRENVAEFSNAFSNIVKPTEEVGSEAINTFYWDEDP